MPKPIIVIKLELEVLRGDLDNLLIMEDIYSKRFHDYHVLCVPVRTNSDEPVLLQVFYEKNFSQIRFEELKKYIVNLINDFNTEPKEEDRPAIIDLIKSLRPNNEMTFQMCAGYGSFNRFAIGNKEPWEWDWKKIDETDSKTLLELYTSVNKLISRR